MNNRRSASSTRIGTCGATSKRLCECPRSRTPCCGSVSGPRHPAWPQVFHRAARLGDLRSLQGTVGRPCHNTWIVPQHSLDKAKRRYGKVTPLRLRFRLGSACDRRHRQLYEIRRHGLSLRQLRQRALRTCRRVDRAPGDGLPSAPCGLPSPGRTWFAPSPGISDACGILGTRDRGRLTLPER